MQRVDEAVKRLNSANVQGRTGNVKEEDAFVQVLKDLAPVDHIVFSGVDKIIRGKLEDLDLEEAKNLFGVKFWGAVVIGKGMLNVPNKILIDTRHSCQEVQPD